MKHTKTKLKNGMRIVTVPMKNNQTVTVMVLVGAGSKYENAKNNGISHFLEHMCFKGTEKRSVFEITEQLDGLGAESNAFTSEEYTGYYAKAHYKHADEVIDVVSDIYLNSALPKPEIEKERGVIIEEINMHEDMPQRIVWDVFEKLLYDGQSVGMTVLGPKENIKKMKRSDFVRYRKKHYVADGTTVVVAGNINEKNTITALKKSFKEIPTTKKHTKKKTKDVQRKPQVSVRYRKTDQAHLMIGCRTFDRYDERNYALHVLATILGQGMSSRLFKIMREELGMCYYTHTMPVRYTDHGYLAVSAGVNKSRLGEASEVILEQMKKLTTESVGDKELCKAKEFIIGNKTLEVESSSDYAMWYGFQELYREPVEDLPSFNRAIQHVTADDVMQVAKDIFTNERLNAAVVGPFKGTKNILQKLKF